MNRSLANLNLSGVSPRVEALVVGLMVAAIFSLLSLSGAMRVGAFNDDGVYTVMGKALAEGRGYVSIHLPGYPVQAKFPPGFPVILALLWRISGSVEGVHSLVGLLHPVVVGATVSLLWWLGRERLGAPRVLLGLFVLTPFLFDASIQYYTIPLSEPWFMLGWAAVVVLWENARQASGRSRLVLLAAVGIIVAATVLVRSQGIVLVPALLLVIATRRFSHQDRLAAITPMLLPLAGWHLYRSALMSGRPPSGLPDDVAYTTWFGGGESVVGVLAGSVKENVLSYISQIGPYISGNILVGSVLATLLIGAMTIGSLAVLRRQPVLGVSALAGLAIVAVWPFAQDRLLLSVMPFGGLACAAWLGPVLARWPAPVRRALGYATVIAMTLLMIRQADIRRESIVAVDTPPDASFFSPTHVLLVNSRFITQASIWIRRNTAPSDRVMIDNHSGIYLYTGRLATPVGPAESRLAPSVFERPGHYLANRILRDSITYVIGGPPKPGITRDIDTVRQRCPRVLSWGGADPDDPRWILKVYRDEPCLSPLATSDG